MSHSFVERFKNKSTLISSSGEISVLPDRAAQKPSKLQLHSSLIQSANHILNPIQQVSSNSSNVHSTKPSVSSDIVEAIYPKVKSSLLAPNAVSPKLEKRKKNVSTTPILALNDLSNDTKTKPVNVSYESKIKEFVPYTIRDYYSIKPKNYYQLGGLGPANVGSEEWSKKKKLNEKRIKYGQNVYYINAAKLPLLPVPMNFGQEDKGENSRTRALQFANTIKKPPLRISLSPN